MRILAVDDNDTNLYLLSSILSSVPEYAVETTLSPVEGLRRAANEQFDMILVDYVMPDMNGVQFIQALRGIPGYALVPIVMITASDQRQVKMDAITSGANDFVSNPLDPLELKARLRNLAALRQHQIDSARQEEILLRKVAEATEHLVLREKDLVLREEEMISRLARAIDYRDGDTGHHVNRVAMVSKLLAEELGLDEDECRIIYLTAPLHDVGKIGIPDAILNKPGKLEPHEFEKMKEHVLIGAEILADGTSSLVRTAEQIAESHHERWDGRGYPHGCKGEEIPLAGRIVAVADVFDALCSERPYKKAWSTAEALAELQKNAGSQFDPGCIAAFERRWADICTIYDTDVE